MTATLTITNPSLQTGDILSFSFTGMFPEWYCYVGIVGGGYAQFYTEVDGSGSGVIGPIGEATGNYTLRVWDDWGNSAIATFTVSSPSQWVAVTSVTTIFSLARAEAEINQWILVSAVTTIFSLNRAEAVVDEWVPVPSITVIFSLDRGAPVIGEWVPVASVTTIFYLERIGGNGDGEETNIPWGPIAIGAGIAVAIGAAIAASQSNKNNMQNKKLNRA